MIVQDPSLLTSTSKTAPLDESPIYCGVSPACESNCNIVKRGMQCVVISILAALPGTAKETKTATPPRMRRMLNYPRNA